MAVVALNWDVDRRGCSLRVYSPPTRATRDPWHSDISGLGRVYYEHDLSAGQQT